MGHHGDAALQHRQVGRGDFGGAPARLYLRQVVGGENIRAVDLPQQPRDLAHGAVARQAQRVASAVARTLRADRRDRGIEHW